MIIIEFLYKRFRKQNNDLIYSRMIESAVTSPVPVWIYFHLSLWFRIDTGLRIEIY